MLLVDTSRRCESLGEGHEILTPRRRFISLLDYNHSFTNLLPLGSLQSEGYCLASFRRRDVGSFPLYALDGGGMVISVSVGAHPGRDEFQRPKEKKGKGIYITESPTLTLPPPTMPLTTVPTKGTDQTSVTEYWKPREGRKTDEVK